MKRAWLYLAVLTVVVGLGMSALPTIATVDAASDLQMVVSGRDGVTAPRPKWNKPGVSDRCHQVPPCNCPDLC